MNLRTKVAAIAIAATAVAGGGVLTANAMTSTPTSTTVSTDVSNFPALCYNTNTGQVFAFGYGHCPAAPGSFLVKFSGSTIIPQQVNLPWNNNGTAENCSLKDAASTLPQPIAWDCK